MKYLVERADGGVTVLSPNGDVDIDQWVAKLQAQAGLVPVSVAPISSLPADRTFRNAWVKGGSGVEVDMPKARDIHMDRIRQARDEKLRELDIEQLKGNDVSAEKQRLRDIPQTLDLSVAATPEELKAIWPEGL